MEMYVKDVQFVSIECTMDHVSSDKHVKQLYWRSKYRKQYGMVLRIQRMHIECRFQFVGIPMQESPLKHVGRRPGMVQYIAIETIV